MGPTASEMGRAAACPASAALPHVHSVIPAGVRGSVGHQFLERVGAGDEPAAVLEEMDDGPMRTLCAAIHLDRIPTGCVPEVALAWNPYTDRGRELGRRIGRRYKEHGLDDQELAGTADIAGMLHMSQIGDRGCPTVYVGDYKFGWRADPWQLRALCLYAARAYGANAARGEFIRVRDDGSVWRSTFDFDAFDLAVAAQDIRGVLGTVEIASEAIRDGRLPTVHEGTHCDFCPAWAHCPAKGAAIARLGSGKVLEPLASLLPFTPEQAGHAYQKIGALKGLIRRIDDEIKRALDQFGSLPLPGGGYVQRVQAEGNEELDGHVLHRVVTAELGREWADQSVELAATKERLKRVLTSAQELGIIPPRRRAAVERKIMQAVREAGGIKRPMTMKTVTVHPGKELP
jgi:hypothetical protein